MRMSCARSFSGAGYRLRRDHHVDSYASRDEKLPEELDKAFRDLPRGRLVRNAKEERIEPAALPAVWRQCAELCLNLHRLEGSGR